ncbi:TerB family tellurite resistance protein [Pontimicrobium sp. MEBiC01747]
MSRVEKLSLLSEMIALSKHDVEEKRAEYNFLKIVAEQLEVPLKDFNYLVENPINYKHLNAHSERILQFHRLVVLMTVDKENTQKQLVKLYNFGLRMGLNHESITRVLHLMEEFPAHIVPTDLLIDIFKVQYN